ncbi:ImmA/IrrE family metallo-endopeptidase [Enterococcus faecium]|uniref:ImmA/IrrE family metallo-endopeptidase n=2 Tax=Enterococcus TaxID=1350 RepID=UPI00129CF3F8|nr:ImmA/IrrE family metallo-endopeptidase [Enterococcus faecium]MCD5093973.1 ImmA/IrrE family metallo-endopeptidase [Enterococcus faecium]MRJ04768.1 ImmA/IrrE family metallo-endopeptidase [Enterococcus faecium]
MNELRSQLDELGVKIVVKEMEKNGYYVPAWKIIFVNQKLSDDEMKRVIVHEMKHVIDHEDYVALYKNFVAHSKMENEANNFMVNYIINENDGFYNYSQVIETFDIGMGYDINYFKQPLSKRHFNKSIR